MTTHFSGNVKYFANVIPKPEVIMHHLQTKIPWSEVLWGPTNRILPRLCCGSVEKYQVGNDLKIWTENFFKETMGVDCNIVSIFGNRYLNGSNWLPDHKDEYGNLHVVSLSFGATRLFRFSDGHVVEPKFYLNSGDIIIFNPQQNLQYKHGIPKQKQITEERINLTCFCVFDGNPYIEPFDRNRIKSIDEALDDFEILEISKQIELL